MLVALPILIPLIAACAGLAAAGSRPLRRAFALLGAGGLLVAAMVLFARVWTRGTQVLHVGGWPAPVGITLVADPLSALMVLTAAVLNAAVTVYALGDIDARRQRHGYFSFIHVMLGGVCGAFLTGDLFNLYVWFEVMLISSFVLMVLGGGRPQLEAGTKYVTLSLMSSALFLSGVGILYGIAHTLNMADLAGRLAVAAVERPWPATCAATLLMLAFGIKAAVFPLHFWLPDSYHVTPPAITAVFAALLTKTGVYALIRVFGLVLPPSPYLFGLLAAIAAATMLMGVLGAVAQIHVRRILNVHIVSQIGYMVMGVALLGAPDPATRRLAIAAALFYVVHNMVVKTNLLLVSGAIRAMTGTELLAGLGGLATRAPLTACIFLVSALSLAGLPPSSGFWAKLGIIQAGFEARAWLLTLTALGVGLLTLLSMLKIWNEVFWKPAPADGPVIALSPRRRMLLLSPAAALTVLSVLIGLYPAPLLKAARRAADGLLDRPAYMAAVGLDAGGTPRGEPAGETGP